MNRREFCCKWDMMGVHLSTFTYNRSKMRQLAIAILLLFAPPSGVLVAQLSTPLEDKAFVHVTGHAEMLEFLHAADEVSDRISLETAGRSALGREIPLVKLSNPLGENGSPKLRVLVFCQQHGNEASGKEAALMLIARAASGELDTLLAQMDLLVIPSVNPDGNEAGKRQNGNGADLNRDHLLLSQPETQAVHAVFNRWKPEVTLDVHEFGALGREWMEAGYVRAMDEQFGAPTNPNVAQSLVRFGLQRMFPVLDAELREQGVRFFNYIIIDGPRDNPRHSTTAINDGRQSFAILNTFSFILEGRNGRDVHEDLARRSRGQAVAITAFLRFVAAWADEIRRLVQDERHKDLVRRDSVALVMDHVHDGSLIVIPVTTIPGGKDSTVSLPHRPVVKTFATVSRPHGYVLLRVLTGVLEVLQRHGVRSETLQRDTSLEVESAFITRVDTVEREGMNILFPSYTVQRTRRQFQAGDVLVPLQQLHATMLVIALEPASMWGLVQENLFAPWRTAGREYPVYRLPYEE